MNKISLINKILKLPANIAFHYQDEFIGTPGWHSNNDYSRPYIKYVDDNSVFIGTTGGPSEASIYDYKYEWKTTELEKSTIKELTQLYNDIKSRGETLSRIYEKYSKEMSMVEFFNLNSNE